MGISIFEVPQCEGAVYWIPNVEPGQHMLALPDVYWCLTYEMDTPKEALEELVCMHLFTLFDEAQATDIAAHIVEKLDI